MRRSDHGRWHLLGALVIALVIAAPMGCGAAVDADGPPPVAVTSATPPVTSAGTPVTSAGTPVTSSAASALAPYLTLAGEYDGRLAAVAALVNRDLVGGGLRLRPATRAAIEAIELTPLARALPAGAGPALTRRSLLVYSELVSRRAAFQGVTEPSPGPDGTATATAGSAAMARARACLANGARARARFAADLAALRVLAASSPAFVPAAASARATAEIAVRTAYVDGWNRCCSSCGGYVTDRLAPVVWGSRDLPDGEHVDGTVDGVGFEASYLPAGGWRIVVHAG